jgi:hypothetical protein
MNRSLTGGFPASGRIEGATRLAPLPLRNLVMGIPGDEEAGDKGVVELSGDGVGFESDLRRPTKSGTPLNRDDRRACFWVGWVEEAAHVGLRLRI